MTRTDTREDMFKWVGPIAEKRFSIYAKKDSPIVINDINDAGKYKIGVQRGGATEEHAVALGFKNLEYATKSVQNLMRLTNGKTDLWYESASTQLQAVKERGIDPDQIKEIFVAKKSMMYIAFNKETPDDIIAKWQKAYDELYASGEVETIFAKYEQQGLYPKVKQ